MVARWQRLAVLAVVALALSCAQHDERAPVKAPASAQLEATAAGGKPVAALRCGDDLFLLSYDGPTRMASGDVEFHGTALMLRRQPSGTASAFLVDATSLRIGARELLATDPSTAGRRTELPGSLRW